MHSNLFTALRAPRIQADKTGIRISRAARRECSAKSSTAKGSGRRLQIISVLI